MAILKREHNQLNQREVVHFPDVKRGYTRWRMCMDKLGDCVCRCSPGSGDSDQLVRDPLSKQRMSSGRGDRTGSDNSHAAGQ
jgi:hypothetical protein